MKGIIAVQFDVPKKFNYVVCVDGYRTLIFNNPEKYPKKCNTDSLCSRWGSKNRIVCVRTMLMVMQREKNGQKETIDIVLVHLYSLELERC